MELDNSIELRIKDPKAFGKVPKWLKHETCCYLYNTVDVAYWKKCWHIRSILLTYLNKEPVNGELILSLEELLDLSKKIKFIYNKNVWEPNKSDWTWLEVKKYMLRQSKLIKKGINCLKNKPQDSYEVVFYDLNR